jgi:hypothetical protein
LLEHDARQHQGDAVSDERTACLFEPTGERHRNTGQPKWRCSRPGCKNVCWGEVPADGWCQADRSTIAVTPPPPATFAAHSCVLGLRGDVVGQVDCGCGGRGETMEVARCGLTGDRGGNGYCTPRNLGGGDAWRRLEILTERPRACSTCKLLLDRLPAATAG